MSFKLRKVNDGFVLAKRALSAKPTPKVAEKQEASRSLKQTKLPNGLLVIGLENYAPVARVGVFVRAGARFETQANYGVTHCLRNAAGFSTKKSTIFGITRNLEHIGGFLTATATREDMIYKLGNSRQYSESNLGYLADTVTRPAYKPWELEDFAYRMETECEQLKINREAALIELLHKAAFRGGLSNSLYSPDYMLGHHDHNMLMEYFNDYYLSKQMVVVGLGLDHDYLVDFVEKNFTMNNGEVKPSKPSKFVSTEVRIDQNEDVALAAVVTEGASTKNFKDMLCLSLFQHLLGSGPRIKYNPGGSILQDAASKASQNPSVVSALNISYSDSGLFGFVVAGAADDMNSLIKGIVGRMRETAKSLKDEHLVKAKNALKTSYLMDLESNDSLLDEIGTQALNFGKVLSLPELEAAIDGITLSDLSSVANRVMKGKGAMASMGKLHNMPYLEDIV
ncbi:cytochrome b-c1 complex subunit 2-like protein [Dinothrombium tinctorium]|uniref:Cytochrome b-c1 complex subunit 2-like protein n=1 Tax=Dinothrombium tinctorium TaxID=1965070 RepID=A0A3S3PBY5_9ACAR|nr:cytochrome b-c1 complex subunit 2-like protein [Dinothrombium tinctorium]